MFLGETLVFQLARAFGQVIGINAVVLFQIVFPRPAALDPFARDGSLLARQIAPDLRQLQRAGAFFLVQHGQARSLVHHAIRCLVVDVNSHVSPAG